MRALFISLAAVLVLSGQATAQATAYSIAVFPGSATNPDTAVPVAAAVTYPIAQVACNLSKVSEVPPIVDPTEGRFNDPADEARDCAIPIAAQFRALPAGSAYKAAYRAINAIGPSPWSTFSTAFAVTAQAHPCDGTPPTTGTVLEGTRTLTWCWDERDVNGSPTSATSWSATVDGVPVALSAVSTGGTTNAAGKRLFSASLPLTRGTRAVRIAATNATGQAAFSATFTVTVTVPAGVPSVAEIRGIQ